MARPKFLEAFAAALVLTIVSTASLVLVLLVLPIPLVLLVVAGCNGAPSIAGTTRTRGTAGTTGAADTTGAAGTAGASSQAQPLVSRTEPRGRTCGRLLAAWASGARLANGQLIGSAEFGLWALWAVGCTI